MLLGATSTDLTPTVIIIVVVNAILLLLVLHAREIVSRAAFLLGGSGGRGAPSRDKVTGALNDPCHVFHGIRRRRGQA